VHPRWLSRHRIALWFSRWTEGGEIAGVAVGATGVADAAAVQDQRVVEEGPPLLWKEFFEVLLDFVGILVPAELQPAGEPADMGIDGDGGPAEGVARDHVGGLTADSRQGEQSIVVFGHFTPVEVHDPLSRRHDVLGFVAKQADRLDEGLDLFGTGFGEGRRIGIGGEECRCGGVDADVGGLRREDRSDKQLKRCAEGQFCGRVGIALIEGGEHLLGSEAFVGNAFSGHWADHTKKDVRTGTLAGYRSRIVTAVVWRPISWPSRPRKSPVERARMRTQLVMAFVCYLWITTTAVAQPDPRDNFDRWDRNKDQRLTRDELPEGVRRNFDRLDANGDGHVSREEHDEFVRRFVNRDRSPARNQPMVPDSVIAKRDIPYAGSDHPRQRLDLYLPKEPTAEKLPLVVFIHGGGWQNGDKAGGAGRVMPFVRSGEFAGASIGYRLSGDATWPAQIHDCKAAIRWLRAHADSYGIDPERIGVMGSSAGGHLVAMLGTSGDVEALEGSLGDATSVSSRVACVVDYYGPANMLTMGDFPSSIDHNAANSPEAKMLGGAVHSNQARAREASPQTHITGDDPPFLILHGTDDRVVPFDQSLQFDKALQAAGVESLLITVKGGGHGGFDGPETSARVQAFLDRHLRDQKVEIDPTPITGEPRVSR
jgi:acetyl esterase/lipase